MLLRAGHYRDMRATDFDLTEALRHEDVNYTGTCACWPACCPAMVGIGQDGRPGHVSLVSSVAGFRGLPKSLATAPPRRPHQPGRALYLDLHALGMGVMVNPALWPRR